MSMAENDYPEEFDELHRDILDVLEEGRANPGYLAERTGESSQLMNNRLRDLMMADYVEKIHSGLYGLKEQPSSDDPESGEKDQENPNPSEDHSDDSEDSSRNTIPTNEDTEESEGDNPSSDGESDSTGPDTKSILDS